jgi:transposase
MYTRISKVKYGGKTYRYLRIVESTWDKGRVIQRVIANLGDVNLIDKDNLYNLSISLARYAGKKPLSIEELESVCALHYGEIILTKAIWDCVHLESILKNTLSLKKKIKFNYPLCVFIMLVNRLIAPKSKLAITNWQERIYIESHTKPKYQHYLRALDYLARAKEKIEGSLFSRITDLFSLKLNLIFYDLTSTYFEGQACPLAKFGYSRDRRPDKKQIVLGLLVTDEGIPIAHQIYNGNISDKSTLKDSIDTLKKRFSIKRCIFVGDRGLVSQENLNYLIAEEYSFIVALRKRNSNEVKDILRSSSSNNYSILNNILHFKEVSLKGMRYLICKNPQKEENDKVFRDNLIKNVSGELKKSSKASSAQSKLRRAAETLAEKKAKRYFIVGIDKQNNFFWQLNEEAINYEEELDGVYILKTNCIDIPASEVVKAYKNLCEVEDAFREIKDFLRLRPIYHYSPQRVKGHVIVCVLAYLIEKLLEKSLNKANLKISPREALDYLSTLRLVENRIAGQHLFCVTTPSRDHYQILKSVNIKNLPRILKT